MFPYILQGLNIIIAFDSDCHTITTSHVAYEKIKQAIKDNDESAVREFINPKTVILNFAQGNVEIKGSEFFWKGKPMHNALSIKMIEMLKEGFPIDPLVNFMDNLQANPSKRAVDELFDFLAKGALPITEDGYFLAYKKVRADYMDCHTGTISNHVGAVPTMDRNEVDDDKDRTCSAGLHFCSLEYLKSFSGERTMILKIDPADVVSIPKDYNDSKGRCCKYEVIGELDAAPEQAFTKSVQNNAEGVKRVEPKTGHSEFYRGYSAGFQGIYNAEADSSDPKAYGEGYTKGSTDRWTGNERYRYKASLKSAVFSWPMPKQS